METTVIKRENSIETENFSQTLVVTEDPFSPDILSHLTKLVADMGQDRNDLLDYITKLEIPAIDAFRNEEAAEANC